MTLLEKIFGRRRNDDSDQPADPRLREPDRLGMPGELVDTTTNVPGDQTPPPVDNAR